MKDRISVMIPEEKIKSRIAELGEEISRDYEGKSIHMICVLKGGVYFMTALSGAGRRWWRRGCSDSCRWV